MTDLIVVGGGEHARVVIEAARSQPEQWRVVGYADLQPVAETGLRLGVAHLGDDAAALAYCEAHGARLVLGVGAIGQAPRRAAIAARFPAALFVSLIDRGAHVSPTALVSPGAVVLAGAVVATGARVGAHAVVNHGAVVEHDVVLGDFTQVGPGAAIGGGAAIGWGSYLALGSRVRDHVRVGARVMVGMGAVVVDSLQDDVTAVGVPARVRR